MTLFDTKPAEIADLSSQFFLRPVDVGKPRAAVTVPRVSELNPYTPVKQASFTSLTDDINKLNEYKVVVLTDTPLKEQLLIADHCHKHGISIVIADIFGLFGTIFTDFGKNFTVGDPTGENPISGIVAGIDEEGMVTVADEARHGLEDGDFVTFTELEGMEGLNNAPPIKVVVKGPYTFSIGDVSKYGQYRRGGLFTQAKMPKIINFKPLSEEISNPTHVISDFAKFDRPGQLHVGFQALHAFAEQHKGQYPRPHHEVDAEDLLKCWQKTSLQNSGSLSNWTTSLSRSSATKPRAILAPWRLSSVGWPHKKC